jgi:hypothetical protein
VLTREDDELSVDPKRRKTMDLYIKEREGKTQCRLPKPESNAKYQCRALLLAMGAGEAGGGRRGWWGQAKPMGAVSHRPKSLVNTPPLAQGFPDRMKQNQRNKQKSEILLRVPNSTKKNPNKSIHIQRESK